MPYSVIIIFLISCFVLFRFWWWIFRKTASKTRRWAAPVLLTILTVPAVYVVGAFIWMEVMEYYPNRKFDQNAWKTNPDTRYEYTHDLIKNKILIGKTRPQILQLLGDNGDTSQTEMQYYIGTKPELLDIDPSSLIIDFEHGKVDAVTEQYR